MRRGLIEYLFQYYAYDIGIRNISNDRELPTENNPKEYHLLRATQKEWYADPFCVEHNNSVFVFCEVMDKTGLGKIGVSSFKEGSFGPVVSVLEEPFHLSYPNVFFYNGKHYMIPETYQAQQIRLYEATDFPYKWKLKKILAENLCVVDTSILSGGEKAVLYTKENKLDGICRWFFLDCRSWELQEFEMHGQQDERPGGNAFMVNDDIVRPLQECRKVYGEKVLLYTAPKGTPRSCERLLSEVTAGCIDMCCCKKYERLHTLNRTDNYEVIDLQYKKFYPLKPVRRILQMIETFYKN